jgi:hypothetical protein
MQPRNAARRAPLGIPDMRTEIENAVSEIKQGITLLRRHL